MAFEQKSRCCPSAENGGHRARLPQSRSALAERERQTVNENPPAHIPVLALASRFRYSLYCVLVTGLVCLPGHVEQEN